ncbi:MAG: hypothetical protein IH951_15960 [Bacteroidetes bacterium]|nr:hypothetical protein [Bacteroidota bacterium]
MIRTNNVVLILGAGASYPYGFPTGERLVDLMTNVDDIKLAQFMRHVRHFSEHHIKEFCEDLGNSGLSSIDRFLQRRQDYSAVGKSMIAFMLMKFESAKNLRGSAEGRWYRYLYNDIINALTLEEFANNHLNIITYNYDRSLEKFFFDALKSGFHLTDPDAAKWAASIPIVHVHGSFGPLPWMGNDARQYSDDYDQIEAAKKRLHIVSDDIEESGVMDECGRLLDRASHVVFLGFGYDPVNVDRLQLQDRCANAQFVGTRYDMTESEIRIVNQTQFAPQNLRFSWEGRDVDCLSFLRQHRDVFF